ncbi:Phosphatidylinositol-3-phosphatase SAC1, partial [Cryomyces antarcticus]
MSGLDVEALLDSTARAQSPEPVPNRSSDREDRRRHDRSDNRDRDRDRRRDGSRDGRRREKSKERSKVDGDIESGTPKSDKGSANGSLKDRRSSRKDLPDDNFRASGGDYYRGGGRPRTRSRSPDEGRYYRPSGGRNRRERDDDHLANRDRYRDRDRGHRGGRGNYGGRRRSTSPRGDRRSKSKTPQPTEDERDRRTIFVQQLAARLRTRELKAFFEKVGPVNEAQIVKDRVSGRSKG